MSHFTVMVIGNHPEKQLAPFHQFECTGDDNEFVKDIDITEELRKKWETGKVTRLKDADGKLHSPYEDRFYREFTAAELDTKKGDRLAFMGTGYDSKLDLSYTSKDWGDGKGYRAKAKFIPEGFTEVEVTHKEYQSFYDYVTDYEGKTPLKVGERRGKDHKYGFARVTEDKEVVKVVDRTNPHYKWDWYQLGGRWTGFFKLKSNKSLGNNINDFTVRRLASEFGTTTLVVKTLIALLQDGDFNKKHDFNMKNPVRGGYQLEKELQRLMAEEYDDAAVGTPGLGAGVAKAGYVDQARLGDIDIEGMVREATEKALAKYDMVLEAMGGEIPKIEIPWSVIADDNGPYKDMKWDKRRELYRAQDALKKFEIAKHNSRSKGESKDLTWLNLEDFTVTREEYGLQAGNKALSTFAVLKDGEWFEKGEMGWFGVSHNNKKQSEWNGMISELLKGLDPDTMISIYDCHI